MKDFGFNCDKCGIKNIENFSIKHKKSISQEEADYFNKTQIHVIPAEKREEHLHIKCKICGYEFKTRCADYLTSKKEVNNG